MRISLGSDHRGVHIKARLIQSLQANSFEVIDEGTFDEVAVDYPDYAECVARRVSCGEAERGILICGTGIGMAITANKFLGVRAAPCYDEVMVEMSRRHNDVNVLCLPGDLIGERSVDDLVLRWLQTDFDGGRHSKRLDKICKIETKNGDHLIDHTNGKSPENEAAQRTSS
ncbi:ribose 5-phosphate isomerase B [Rhodopirellula sp. MGV]|uniref:ribose 5-phosphate isomerase B n=1 Tax=Rhodopirellula sp. MGV TaxID=2023130 RepID=UPI000B96E7CE|nr:ribose 5-phosphate isomerase B [Rhodopirellula sp. MGV]OYP29500.1 ribose 5-phosphate isomerase B [Rhodopirellula sp. MGV]PNY33804.1 ribose 5-phosphate isomerase B [Rhodopirellula baltica]